MMPPELIMRYAQSLTALGAVLAIDASLAAPFIAAEIEAAHAREQRAANGVRASEGRVGQAQTGGVAILPVTGMIRPRSYESFFGTVPGLDRFRSRLAQSAADEATSAIVVFFDTPGGSVVGMSETWEAIRAAAAVKPVIAYCDGMCASAGYWLASACTEIHAAPEALVGSIGVIMSHTDMTKYLDKLGYKITLIANSPEKTESYPYVPLSPEALAHRQGLVATETARFHAAVAKGRNVSVAQVRDEFGLGRALDAAAAKKAGMIDAISTFDQVVAKAVRTGGRARPAAPRRGLSRSARFALGL